MPRDWLDARFAGQERKKRSLTGLAPSPVFVHRCSVCGTWNSRKTHNPDPPAVCEGFTNNLSGLPCRSTLFDSFNELEVEAMPIGRVTSHISRRTNW